MAGAACRPCLSSPGTLDDAIMMVLAVHCSGVCCVNYFASLARPADGFSALGPLIQGTPKDTTKAKFIKYLNDKTVVFNNQIITGLLLLRTDGCKHCQTRGFTV